MTFATRVSRVEIKLLLFKICKKPGNVYKMTEDPVKKQVLPHLEDNSMNIINRIRKLRHVSQEVSRMLLTNKCNGRRRDPAVPGPTDRSKWSLKGASWAFHQQCPCHLKSGVGSEGGQLLRLEAEGGRNSGEMSLPVLCPAATMGRPRAVRSPAGIPGRGSRTEAHQSLSCWL